MERQGLCLGLVILVLYGHTRQVAGCNINNCVQSVTLFASCQDYTSQLQCIKREYDSCTSDADRQSLMMSSFVALGVNRGPMCGFDLAQIQDMMTARTGLMMSMYNSTAGGLNPALWYGGDDGPMGDDGPFDDGPFDDGPFDDGPFDDGPFDDDGWGFMGMTNFLGGKSDPKPTVGANTAGRAASQSNPVRASGISSLGMARQTDDRDVKHDNSGRSIYAPVYVTMVLVVVGRLVGRH